MPGLTRLLADDVVLEMPPVDLWLAGPGRTTASSWSGSSRMRGPGWRRGAGAGQRQPGPGGVRPGPGDRGRTGTLAADVRRPAGSHPTARSRSSTRRTSPGSGCRCGQTVGRLLGQEVAQDRDQRPEGLAAVADRVLLGVGELGGRPRLAVGHEDRVVAEPVGATRLADEVAVDLAVDTTASRPSGRTSATAQAKCAPSRSSGTSASWASTSSRFATSPLPPDQRAERTPGMPVERVDAQAASRRRPRARRSPRTTARALSSALLVERRLGLGDLGHVVERRRCRRPRRASPASSRIRRISSILCALRVARTTRSVTTAPSAVGLAARVSSAQPAAREVEQLRRAARGRTARPRRCPAPRRSGRRRSDDVHVGVGARRPRRSAGRAAARRRRCRR